jgi:hypothetical protein
MRWYGLPALQTQGLDSLRDGEEVPDCGLPGDPALSVASQYSAELLRVDVDDPFVESEFRRGRSKRVHHPL